MTLVDDLLARINRMPDDVRSELSRQAIEAMPIWFPNAGPQAKAYFCAADILLAGGMGGGGKTDLGLGLAFTQHRRSLVMRRRYANLGAIMDRAIEINGTRQGFNGASPPRLTTRDGRLIEFGANQHLGDEQSWQGQPWDLKYFDEAVQFLELQIRFHIGWIRSVEEGQRCRAVLGTNPPLEATGDWIIGMFRPWLDVTHPNPAKHGELRWYVTAPDGKDVEVAEQDLGRDDQGRRPIQLDGQVLFAMSRTFIPMPLSGNPPLARTDYQAKLDALPEPIRSAVRDGNFMAARKDADFQVIPTAHALAAQARWKPDGYKAFAMTVMSFDPAGGGRDDAVLAWRHGFWYAPLLSEQGEETADGSLAAAKIIQHRRDNAPVVVDAGGGAGHGFGGTTIMRLRDNGIPVMPFNGASPSTAKTRDGMLTFANTRAEAWWRMREALDPDQEGGSVIALPPDPELLADLTTPTYEPTARGILVEEKKKIRERIGRSPGKGDAVVMALSHGDKAVKRELARRAPPIKAVLAYPQGKRYFPGGLRH